MTDGDWVLVISGDHKGLISRIVTTSWDNRKRISIWGKDTIYVDKENLVPYEFDPDDFTAAQIAEKLLGKKLSDLSKEVEEVKAQLNLATQNKKALYPLYQEYVANNFSMEDYRSPIARAGLENK